ncbi:TetR/AcrR family transcriptional regulator [Geobacter sp. FeAm09]|uniref:TetR/AcrR family transcriptional regulator n=1 Tax=Geobacter sp. FeAm09 TaxID=2597769 RepID=UPI0011ED1975|nr:TetR/AcrR family transcriptional regulator [Geobacter sp. FeAm09]QEM66827.1 TetR/AcrR family transcriptional regulator [Geobacter sp. FeAm09]
MSCKRDDIFNAARKLIVECGFHGASVSLIADRAGVGAGTIYLYFKSKDILINELYRDIEQRVSAFILKSYPERGPIRERFIHLGMRLMTYFIANPLDFRYGEQYYNSPYGMAYRRDRIMGEPGKRTIYNELFEQGIAQQVLKDLPFFVIDSLAFGPLLAVMRDHILGFIDLDGHLIEEVVAASWDSVRR